MQKGVFCDAAVLKTPRYCCYVATALGVFMAEFILFRHFFEISSCSCGENPDPQRKQVCVLKLQRIAQKWEISAA